MSSKKKILSIDLGQHTVKIAYAETKGGGVGLLGYDLKDISSAQDRAAEITAFIRDFIKANHITEKDICLTISDPESVSIKHLTIPQVPKDEIAEAAKWQLKEEISFNLDNALVDWQVISEETDAEGAKSETLTFAVAKADIARNYLSLVGRLGLSPILISCAPFNYANILKGLKAPEGSAQAVLDIGYKQSALSVYFDGKPAFVRILPFSSQRLTESLTGTLLSDKGKIELNLNEAERIKVTYGVLENANEELEGNINAMQIISLMRPLLEGLSRELKRSFDYFSANFKDMAVGTLYIAGGGANLKKLDSYLNKELGINIVKLPIPNNIDTGSLAQDKLNNDCSQLLNVLGSVLAGPKSLNLLPSEIKTRKLEFIESVSLRVGSVALAGILLFSIFIANFQVQDYKKRLVNAQQHLNTIGQIETTTEKLYSMRKIIGKIQEDRVPVGGMLKLLSSLAPENVALSELRFEQDGHTLDLKGIVGNGSANAETVLTNFMQKLEEQPYFLEATLQACQRCAVGHEFRIKCDLIQD